MSRRFRPSARLAALVIGALVLGGVLDGWVQRSAPSVATLERLPSLPGLAVPDPAARRWAAEQKPRRDSATTPATLRAAPAPSGPTGLWQPVFAEEFAAPPAPRTWATCYDWACNNAGQHELQHYSSENVTVSGGALRLTVRQQRQVGAGGRTYDYTSGMVQSNPGFRCRYGYAEMRARLPAGRGLWPAFWLLPTDHSWPPEIDVMEAAGDRPRTVTLTMHYGRRAQTGRGVTGPDFTAGFHTFGVDWEPRAITWYVDGVPRMRFTDRANIPRELMYLLVNVAVDGENPPGRRTGPAAMDVDYVRVWQRATLLPPLLLWPLSAMGRRMPAPPRRGWSRRGGMAGRRTGLRRSIRRP